MVEKKRAAEFFRSQEAKDEGESVMVDLDAKRLVLAGGIVWGLTIFGTNLFSVITGYATIFLNMYASLYPGYTVSPAGSVVGLVYAFSRSFAGLYVFAWLYNWLEKKI